jgi:hypothetical protein
LESQFNCNVCGGEMFSRCDYMTRAAACPALECEVCRAITLDEDVARTPGERESVRGMLAIRARIHADACIADDRAAGSARVAGASGASNA